MATLRAPDKLNLPLCLSVRVHDDARARGALIAVFTLTLCGFTVDRSSRRVRLLVTRDDRIRRVSRGTTSFQDWTRT